jgi:hypothetical protein
MNLMRMEKREWRRLVEKHSVTENPVDPIKQNKKRNMGIEKCEIIDL